MVSRVSTDSGTLTELGVDYVTRQVPVGKEQRQALRQTTGSVTIPTLVSESGTVAIGEEAIRRYLDQQIAERRRRTHTD
jgi:glutathione S-transferase